MMKRSELASLLRKVADGVASGDSAEGSIGWLMGEDVGEVEVEASIRTGNLEGQGGIILINPPKPAPKPAPVYEVDPKRPAPVYEVDPKRIDLGRVAPTLIFVHARSGDTWGSYDIVTLTYASLMAWLRSRGGGGDNALAESVVAFLLAHPAEPQG